MDHMTLRALAIEFIRIAECIRPARLQNVIHGYPQD
jgi:hypothetical protein